MNWLLENPLVTWSARQLRRDTRALSVAALFVLAFYGLVALGAMGWASGRASNLPGLLTGLFMLTWFTMGFALLLWAPARMAQQLARDRARGQLDALRLTGLSGLELTVGCLVGALSLPLAFTATLLPTALLSLGGDLDALDALRAYLILLLLAPVYTLAGGLGGMSSPKPETAGSAGAITAVLLLTASGIGTSNAADLRGLALLGPWAALGNVTKSEEMPYAFGHQVPAELLALPFLLLVGAALAFGLARRLAGEPARLVGRSGALGVAAALVGVATLTFSPAVGPQHWGLGLDVRQAVGWRLVLILAAALLVALESPVRLVDLVRGLARREPDDLPLPDERLDVARYAPLPLLLVGWTILAGGTLAVTDQASPGEPVSLGSFALATLVVVAAFAAAAATFQAAQLLTRDHKFAPFLAGGALMAFWFVPGVASVGAGLIDIPDALLLVPRAANPLHGLYALLAEGSGAFGWMCVGWQALAAGGACYLAHKGLVRARGEAERLVALPADAFAPAGALTRRCERGHLFADTWTSCPHCA